jgi:hypothetical protein
LQGTAATARTVEMSDAYKLTCRSIEESFATAPRDLIEQDKRRRGDSNLRVQYL